MLSHSIRSLSYKIDICRGDSVYHTLLIPAVYSSPVAKGHQHHMEIVAVIHCFVQYIDFIT